MLRAGTSSGAEPNRPCGTSWRYGRKRFESCLDTIIPARYHRKKRTANHDIKSQPHVGVMRKAIVATLIIVFLILPVTFCEGPNWLVKKYGPKLYSDQNEELIIRDFFQDKKAGFFVDVGANDYRINSTTYYLEKNLGWHGLAIDAVCDFEAGYLEHRKNTRFFCFFVSDKSDDDIEFYITEKKRHERRSSVDEKWAQRYDATEKVHVHTITLNDLLAREGVRQLDFLSIDIELAEPGALAGFDIEKYHPALVCIELHKEVRQPIEEYFAKHGYGLLEKYKGLDRINSYFTPLR
jgi:FkbM family methyltransferase